jgi:hypothetical protein
MLSTKLMTCQILPLSQHNKATYASASDLIHVVPFNDGNAKGYLFCNMLRNRNWLSDSLNWSSEMIIACLRSLILEKHSLRSIPVVESGFHWVLQEDQIDKRLLRWSDRKLLKKWDQMNESRIKNETLWLSYILALWKRGYLVEISSEDGDLLLIDPEFIPYRDFPMNRM